MKDDVAQHLDDMQFGAVQALRDFADMLERVQAEGRREDPVGLARKLADLLEKPMYTP